MTAQLAASAAARARAVVPLHQDGWAHYTQGADDVARAFRDADLAEILIDVRPGSTATF
jgi:hypothetical protein